MRRKPSLAHLTFQHRLAPVAGDFGGRRLTVSQPSLTEGGVHVGKGEGRSFWLLTDLHTFKVVGADTNGSVHRRRAHGRTGARSTASHPSQQRRELLHPRGYVRLLVRRPGVYGSRGSVRSSSQGRGAHAPRRRRRVGESSCYSGARWSGTVHRGSWQACDRPVGPTRAARAVGT